MKTKRYIFLHNLTKALSEDVHANSLSEAEDKGYAIGWILFSITK